MNLLWIDSTAWAFFLVLASQRFDVRWMWMLFPLFFFRSLAPVFVVLVFLTALYIYFSGPSREKIFYLILAGIWIVAGIGIREVLFSYVVPGMNEARLSLAVGLFLLSLVIVIGEKGLGHWSVPFLSYIITRLLQLYASIFGIAAQPLPIPMLFIAFGIVSLFILQLRASQFWRWLWLSVVVLFMAVSSRIGLFAAFLLLGERFIPGFYRDLFRVVAVLVLFWRALYG